MNTSTEGEVSGFAGLSQIFTWHHVRHSEFHTRRISLLVFFDSPLQPDEVCDQVQALHHPLPLVLLALKQLAVTKGRVLFSERVSVTAGGFKTLFGVDLMYFVFIFFYVQQYVYPYVYVSSAVYRHSTLIYGVPRRATFICCGWCPVEQPKCMHIQTVSFSHPRII